ncbi:MAG TPA: glutamyl-tRNA reductase [Gemmatimonadales bacterium]|nr:glutamyl-tRNA reductase [Gemmatimonadales bacterium]
MQLVVVGLNHRSAPVAVRERLAFAPADLGPVLARLRDQVQEGFILSTCNRVELYAVAGHADSGAQRVARFLAGSRGVPLAELAPHLYARSHTDAVRHLLSVAAGLDSMVLGEDQILAQVRAALEEARRAEALGPTLHRLGAAALETGKRVRSETGLARTPVSVVSVGLQAALEVLGPLAGRRAVVLGAGRTAALALRHLRDLSPERVTVVNRTLERARPLARATGAEALPWEALEDALAGADLVLSCTGAPHVVVDGATVAGALRRRGAPQVYLDLAVPRDVDPAAAELPGVTLLDIDRLDRIAGTNRLRREAEVPSARAIVDAGVAEFMQWWASRRVTPTIGRLVAYAEAIRDAEVTRTLRRLPDLSPREAALVRGLASRIVAKLLHQPITALKQDPEGATLALALDRLFALAARDEGRREPHPHEERTQLTA